MNRVPKNSVDWHYDDKASWTCPNHQFQSPINIVHSDTKPMNDDGELVLRYRKKIDTMVSTGYCLQGYLKGVASLNSRKFTFQQFHFHSHGEHTIDGKQFPLELHLVHQSDNGKIAVIAVMFDVGEENDTIDDLLNHVNQTNFDNKINLLHLVPKNLDYYHYLGSLTTPPLTENVEWYVLMTPMTLSERQLSRLRLFHKDNYREVQDLNGRQVLNKTFK